MDKIFTRAGPGVAVLSAHLLRRLRQEDDEFKDSPREVKLKAAE